MHNGISIRTTCMYLDISPPMISDYIQLPVRTKLRDRCSKVRKPLYLSNRSSKINLQFLEFQRINRKELVYIGKFRRLLLWSILLSKCLPLPTRHTKVQFNATFV